MADSEFASPRLLAFSGPGSPARHYRVQVWSSDIPTWRLYGAYPAPEQAARCARSLARHGLEARVISFRCPAAA